MSDTWTIFTDGGWRGNPGPAAYAYVIRRTGQPDIEEKAYLGSTTNNIAEYTGMVKALEHARELGGRKLIVNSDSELMVKQMNGQYRVKNAGLVPLYQQAVKLRKQFESVVFKHVYREENSQADALCNEAMDDRTEARIAGVLRAEPSNEGDSSTAPDLAATKEGLTALMQALAVIKRAALRWSDGDASDPSPVEVLNEIVEILRRDEPSAAD